MNRTGTAMPNSPTGTFPEDRNDTGRAHWEAVAAEWADNHPEALWRLHSDAVNARLVARWLPEGSGGTLLKTDLFDEAVSGGLGEALRGRAGRIVGADVSQGTAREAARRAPIVRAVRADVRRLPLADGSVDTILSNSTLDHFDRRDEFERGVAELFRVLRPGGRLLLTLDNRANPVVAVRNALPFPLLNRLGLLPYYVGWTCGPGALRRHLTAAGFEVQEMDAILHCPRLLAIKISTVLARRAGARAQRRFLDRLLDFERLARWPTRFLTGYYIAVRATRPSSPTNRKDA